MTLMTLGCVGVGAQNEDAKQDSLAVDSTWLKSIELMDVVVKSHAVKVKVKGDSLVYNAAAYRVPEGSTLEYLVKQLLERIIIGSGQRIDRQTERPEGLDGRRSEIRQLRVFRLDLRNPVPILVHHCVIGFRRTYDVPVYVLDRDVVDSGDIYGVIQVGGVCALRLQEPHDLIRHLLDGRILLHPGLFLIRFHFSQTISREIAPIPQVSHPSKSASQVPPIWNLTPRVKKSATWQS